MSLNKHMIIGNLGGDAEVRTLSGDRKVANFAVATNEPYLGKDGNWANIVTWHNVSLFNPSDYKIATLKKGVQVYVEGPIRKSDYTKDDRKMQFVRIQADKVNILDKTDNVVTDAPAPAESSVDDDLPF